MSMTTLLASIHEHLATFELPEPWCVTVTSPSYEREPVSVQLGAGALPEVASTLLAWADTLTDISADLWRTRDGSSVHLTIRGRLADGTRAFVFDGVGNETRFALEPGERRPVSLACLREWATLDREVAV
jgi:hypothetical protein